MQFTIIVPIYKTEPFLARCVDSILAQTYPDFEVILVDDGSPDGCPKMCDQYKEKDSRVRVIHKPNGGVVSARKVGILAAQGDYLCYVDADDWIKPNMLQFVHDTLMEAPVPLDMVLFASENVYADHVETMDNIMPEGYYDRARLEKEIFPYLFSDRRSGFLPTMKILPHLWNKAVRRELHVRYYVRDERISSFEDVPLTYETILNCNHIYICNEYLYFYNKMNSNSIMTLTRTDYSIDNFVYLTIYMREHLYQYGFNMEQQLNDYPVHLLYKTIKGDIKTEKSFLRTRKSVITKLRKTGMIRLISLRGLPPKPLLFVLLLKLHLYTFCIAMAYSRNKK